jgi:hypothetical protein
MEHDALNQNIVDTPTQLIATDQATIMPSLASKEADVKKAIENYVDGLKQLDDDIKKWNADEASTI